MSTDSTLAEGQAAVDTATQTTLFCVSSEEYALLAASPARERTLSVSVRSTETPI